MRRRLTRGQLWLAAAAGAMIVVTVLIAGVLVARGTGPAGSTAPPSAGPPIEISGTDPITGKPVSLSDFRGKPVLLNIWASWCPGCVDEADDLRRVAGANPEIAVVGINLRDAVSGARAFYAQFKWTWPSIADRDGAIAARLGLQGMPTTIVLDARHREVARIVGATDEAGFTDALAQAS